MINYKPVDLPERTVTVRTKSGTYVYLTQRVEYSSKLKCSRPKRIAIGKLNEKGMLIPNQNYFDLYGKPEAGNFVYNSISGAAADRGKSDLSSCCG